MNEEKLIQRAIELLNPLPPPTSLSSQLPHSQSETPELTLNADKPMVSKQTSEEPVEVEKMEKAVEAEPTLEEKVETEDEPMIEEPSVPETEAQTSPEHVALPVTVVYAEVQPPLGFHGH